MKTLKVPIEDILLYGIYISIFKIEMIPGTIRQGYKAFILIITLLYLLTKLKKREFLNISVPYIGIIVLSGLINYFQHETTYVAVFEGLIYALGIYDICTLICLYRVKDKYEHCLKCFYNITWLYCTLSIISVIIQGRGDGFTEVHYLFGNKFSTSYLFILLVALYAARNKDYIERKKKWRTIGLIALSALSAFISYYTGCITALLSLIAVSIMIILSKKQQRFLTKPIFPVIGLVASGVVMFFFTVILKIDYVHKLVFDIFGKSASIYGRITIYESYVYKAIQGNVLIGSGYNNGKIFSVSNGVLGNAQNGIFDQFVAYGIIGVLIIILMTFLCYKRAKRDSVTVALSMLVYAMIIAGVVEITIGWFYFIGLFLIGWNMNDNPRHKNIKYE